MFGVAAREKLCSEAEVAGDWRTGFEESMERKAVERVVMNKYAGKK
jgi:hypothetical protein